jgi:CMP-N-acetylneuraminic acid synthetase
MATDESPVVTSLLHAIDLLLPSASSELTVVLLEPTSPLRPKGFIDQALNAYWTSGACSAVSVGKSGSQHPSFSVKMTPKGFISQYDGAQLSHLRRQDAAEVYFLEGSFYATRLEFLRKSGEVYSGTILGITVKKWQEIEIDDLDDFTMAESLGTLHSNEL